MKGFTLSEVLVVISIFLIGVVLGLPAFRAFQNESDILRSGEQIQGALRLAQSKTVASEDESRYGVFFDNTTNPHQYTLFKGNSYGSRILSFDEIHRLPSSLQFSVIDFAGGTEVVFDKITGATAQAGSVSIRLISDPSRVETLYVEGLGKIASVLSSAPSDASRIKDSRHAHLEYIGRTIDTATESLRIVFPSLTKVIPLASNMQGGQIYWEETVVVDGDDQRLKIHTHVLNDVSLRTVFSIHRDRRYNTKGFSLELSGDSTGDLVSYDLNGITSSGTSLYVLVPALQ